MQYWKRTLISQGFEWTSQESGSRVLLQVQDNRWTATLFVALASGKEKKNNFFAEDSFNASMQKCLLYVWRALRRADKATFDLAEAVADLHRFVS